MEVILKKLSNGALAPANEEEFEKMRHIKPDVGVRCKVTVIRNYKFLKKYFALMAYLFDMWEEAVTPQLYRGQEVKPNRNKFRKDLIILTGRFQPTFNVRGDVQLEADSISFDKMTELEFSALYSDLISVALGRVLNRPDLTAEKITAHVETILRFDY